MAIYSIGFRCCHFRCSYQADMHPIVTSRASTSQRNAIVPLVFAGVLTDTALNLPIPAQEANQIAVNNSENIFSSRENNSIQSFFCFVDEVIVNAAALTSDDEDDASDDDDDDDSTEGSADNMLAF